LVRFDQLPAADIRPQEALRRGTIQPSSRRPNHTSSRPFSIGLRPTDQPARLVVMNKGIPPHMILLVVPLVVRAAPDIPDPPDSLRKAAAIFDKPPPTSHPQSFMGTFVIKFLPPQIQGFLLAVPGSNSVRMSRCNRSCPPLSWGCPGRPRSRSIPKATHQATTAQSQHPRTCARGCRCHYGWLPAIHAVQTTARNNPVPSRSARRPSAATPTHNGYVRPAPSMVRTDAHPRHTTNP